MAERRALVTVSGTIDPRLADPAAALTRPRADYVELAEALGADLLDRDGARARGGRIGALIERVAGPDVLMAWAVHRSRRRYDVVLTDGEQVGLPLAAFSWFARRRTRPRHTMIVHIMSVPKKVALFRALRLHRRIDAMVVYASAQRDAVVERLGMPADRVLLSPFMVDTDFFAPHAAASTPPRRMICSAGLEFRDYDTLLAAVDGLDDVEVVIAAASPWSKRTTSVGARPLPTNVTVEKLDLAALRELYRAAALVVMPLRESEFQAGITTILEAMAMGKAIVCSRTSGQTDTIADGVTGRYVPPGDGPALRAAITELLDDPATAERLGQAARAWAVEHADVAGYARRLADFARG